MLTVHLPEDVESSIKAEVVDGHFASVDDAIARAWQEYLQRKQQQAGAPTAAAIGETDDDARRPIWERILELTADVPDEVWDQLPTDLSEQHDHYIYGTPKRPEA